MKKLLMILPMLFIVIEALEAKSPKALAPLD